MRRESTRRCGGGQAGAGARFDSCPRSHLCYPFDLCSLSHSFDSIFDFNSIKLYQHYNRTRLERREAEDDSLGREWPRRIRSTDLAVVQQQWESLTLDIDNIILYLLLQGN